MPTPTATPVRVAECRRCGQLFAVNATEGEIACPACEATSSVASLQIVELGVAAPVEVKVEAPAAPKPEPAPTPVEEPPTPVISASVTTPVEEEKPKQPPTVAEWLLQSEQRAAPAPTADRAAESKRSLAESLGWNPGSFDIKAKPTLPKEAAPTEPEAPADKPAALIDTVTANADTLSDFRFDFGATPLSEHNGNADETAEAEGVSLELSEQADEAPQPLRLEELGASKGRSRGWGSFLGMAAGLMLIAGPAAYFATTWDGSGGDSLAELASRDAFAEEASTTPPPEFVDESAATNEEPPAPFAAEDPFVDREAKPASFDNAEADEPAFDMPPNAPTEVTRPAGLEEADEEPSLAPLADDPFLAQPPAASAAESTPPALPPASERYTTVETPQEPAEFAPPAGQVDEMVEPAAAFAEPRPLAVAPPVEGVALLNAPTYGARELTEAFGPAESAARGFAGGTLADPAQVSVMGQHYARLCYLAQVLTLLDASDPSLLTTELQAADAFKRLFRSEKARAESRQIAGPWIAWTGRPHGGVFFAGKPEEIRSAGKAVQYQFRIGDQMVPIVMAKPIDTSRFVNSGAVEVGVIGVVVENPREWIAGYDGDAERVVWVRKTLPLPPAEDL